MAASCKNLPKSRVILYFGCSKFSDTVNFDPLKQTSKQTKYSFKEGLNHGLLYPNLPRLTRSLSVIGDSLKYCGFPCGAG